MKLIGHRGAKDEWPENTLLGFEKTIESGAHGIEVDVQVTKDNQLAIIHDETLERTTNGQGFVKNYELSEIQELDAGKNEKVPNLDEVIQFSKSNNILLFIESKSLGIEQAICDSIQRYEAHEKSIVISFNHHFIKKIKSIDGQIKTGCLIEATPIDPVQIVKNAKADVLIVARENVTPQLVEQCHNAQIEVGMWSANTKQQFKDMKALNIDYIMTDRPSLIGPLL